MGGLGLRKMKDVNMALIAKLGWKMHTNFDCTWVSQLRGKYLNSCSVLSSSSHSSTSWLWKGILKSKGLIAQGACHKIHFSSPLSIWNAPWIPSLPSVIPTSKNQSHLSHSMLSVSDLFPSNFSWNIPLLNSLFETSSVREILKIKIETSSSFDFLWTPSSNGLFSSKLAFNLISSSRTVSAFPPLEPNS